MGSLAPHIYLMFLAHTTIMTLMWGAWQLVWGKGLEWPYPIFYVAAPPVTLLLVVQLYRVLRLTPRWLQVALNGRPATAGATA